MKKRLLLSSIFVLLQQSFSFSQNLQWAKSMGGASHEIGHFITIDAAGNVYTTGFFWGTVDFDPGTGVFNLTAVGEQDIFISKLDASGNFCWAKALSGIGYDQGDCIATDAFGNVYTTGYFRETADFDPGVGTFNLSSSGVDDIFISKLDTSGNFIWAKSIGGGGDDIGVSITTDPSGNVYTTGFFKGAVDFDPSAGTFNLTSQGPEDIFISKLDASGNFVWAKSMGGTGSDFGVSVSIDISDNVYTTGYFNITADFDPGTGTFNLVSSGNEDIFIQKLDASGNFLWANSMGGAFGDYGNSLTLDASGNVYTKGSFQGTADFDPGAGVSNLVSAGSDDIFIQKLDASGNFLWAKSMGGASSDFGTSITLDASGNIFTTGHFQGTADFDPGSGTYNLVSTGSWDIFIQKLDGFGNFLWAKSMGGASPDRGYSIAVGATGNVYTTGYFNGTVDFDPNADTSNLTSAGAEDIYVLKMNPAFSLSGTIYQSDSITQITSGKVYLIENIPGNQLAFLDSFTLSGSGNYSFSNVASGNYLIQAKPNNTNYPNAIPTYYGDTAFWQGAVNINLTANTTGRNIKVKELAPLTGIGSLSGKMQYGIGSGKTGNGAAVPFGDPVPNVDIILDEIPGGIKAHTTTDMYGNYAFINVPLNAQYKIIIDFPGLAMDSTYVRTLNSDFPQFTGLDFVIDTASGDTGIYVGWPLSVNEFQNGESGLRIYPNPNSGTFTIEWVGKTLSGECTLTIHNMLGEQVFVNTLNTPFQPLTLNLSPGMYQVLLENSGNTVSKRIILK